MAEKTEYELLSAYVKLLPSMRGFTGAVAKELGKSTTEIDSAFSKALKGLANKSSGMFSGIGSGLIDSIKGAADGITNVIKGAITAGASTFSDTLKLGASAAGAGLMAGIGAVGGQIVAGGLTRALGINQAEAKLQALGYTAGELEKIMEASGNAIDGTSYAMNESVTAAAQFLSAGIAPGKELEKSLKNVSKLADISGRSFNDMGSIMAKNASAGIVQWTDLVQLIDAGIPVQDYLAKNLGKTTAEIRKMASAGEITYKDFTDAIESVNFDSVIYATKDVGKAFQNVRSQLSKAGANLWTPIIDGLGPILNNVRGILVDFQKSDVFKELVESWNTIVNGKLGKVGDKVKDIAVKFKNTNIITDYLDKLKKGFKSLEGIEGPLLGIVAGLSGGLLSQIPIIGSMFSGLTVPVGLVGGALFQTYKNSKKLQEAFGGLKEAVINLFSGSGNFGLDANFFKSIGDTISEIVNTISGVLGDLQLSNINFDFGNIIKLIVNEVSNFVNTVGPAIVPFIEKLSSTFNKIFEGLSFVFNKNNEGVSLGEGIGNIFNGVISIIGNLLDNLAPIVVSLASVAIDLFKSDAIQNIIEWLVSVADSIVSNQGILTAFISVAGAIFVGNKLFGPLDSLFKWLGKNKKVNEKIGTSIGKVIGGFIKGLAEVSKVILKNIGYILGGIAAIGVILAAVGGIYWILSNLGIVDQLKNFGGDLIEGMRSIATAIIGIVGEVADLFIGIGERVLQVVTEYSDTIEFASELLVSSITTIIESLTTGLTNIINSVANLWGTVFEGLDILITDLSLNGVSAGAGALALATGLTALAGGLAALAGGSLINSFAEGLGNLWTGFTNFITGGEKDPAEDIIQFIDKITSASALIEGLPEKWALIGDSVFTLGLQIPYRMSQGINSNSSVLYGSLFNLVNGVLNNLQNYLNTHPLQIRAELDSRAKSLTSGSVNAVRNNTNNTTNNTNFNVNTQNQSFIRSLVYASR